MINITFEMFVHEILRLLAGETQTNRSNQPIKPTGISDHAMLQNELEELNISPVSPGDSPPIPVEIVENVIEELCEIITEPPHPYFTPRTESLRWLYDFMSENDLMGNLFPETPDTNRYTDMTQIVGMSRDDLASFSNVNRMSLEGKEKRRSELEEARREREAIELQNRLNRIRFEQRLKPMLIKDSNENNI